MKNTIGLDMISKVLYALRQSEEDIRRNAVEAAAAETGAACGVGAASVTLFSDCTGNYAEVILPASYDCVCGMKLCCIVDTDTMQTRGICPVG